MQKGSVYFLILMAAEGCRLTSVAGDTATVVFSINLSTVMVAYDDDVMLRDVLLVVRLCGCE